METVRGRLSTAPADFSISGSAVRTIFLLPVLVVASCWSAPLKGAQDVSSAPYHIFTDVNLVVLDIAVLDHHGGFVAGLDRENFEILENGRPQPITLFRREDAPVTVGLLVDGSASMLPKRKETVAAALAFVQASNPADEVFVVNFNETVSLGLPPSMPFTNDQSALADAINRAPAVGRTALYDAIAAGLTHLRLGARPRKALIVFSDGGDNESVHTLPEILSLLEESGTLVYTIGLFGSGDREGNPKALKKLARASGGQAFFPQSLKEVSQICRSIAAEIRSRYVAGYVPQNLKEGEYRSLAVKVHCPGRGRLEVRARAGFRVPRVLNAGEEDRGG
jgi:Ca-activated chloride channel family protein